MKKAMNKAMKKAIKKVKPVLMDDQPWTLPVLFTDLFTMSGNAHSLRINFGAWRSNPKGSFIQQASIGMPTDRARQLHIMLGEFLAEIDDAQ